MCVRARHHEKRQAAPRVRRPVAQRQVAKMHLSMNCWQNLALTTSAKCGVDIYDDKYGESRRRLEERESE